MPPSSEPALGSGMSWGVKRSFLQYVLADATGSVGATGGATFDDRAGMPSWLLASATEGEHRLVMEFTGAVRFRAHFGMLDVELDSPRLAMDGIDGAERMTASLSVAAAREPIATFDATGLPTDGTRRVWIGDNVALTPAGSELLGGVYAVGQRMDPLIIVVHSGITAGRVSAH